MIVRLLNLLESAKEFKIRIIGLLERHPIRNLIRMASSNVRFLEALFYKKYDINLFYIEARMIDAFALYTE